LLDDRFLPEGGGKDREMAEYYAVLSRAIGGLTNASPETRRAVYDKARNALVAQLRAIDPPLPTSEISRQRLELEEAIRRIEREIQTGTLPPPPPPLPQRPSPQVLPSPRIPEPEGSLAAAAAARRSPQDIFRQAILDAEGRGWPVPVRGGEPASDRAAARAQAGRSVPFEGNGHEDVPEVRASRGPADPQLAPEYGYNGSRETVPPPERPRLVRRGPAPIDDEIDEMPQPQPAVHRGWGRRRGRDVRTAGEPRRRRSRVPLLIGLFVILTGGVAFAAWTQLPTIQSIIASFDLPASREAPRASIAATDPAATKNGDRLLPGSAAPAPQPDRDVRIVDTRPPGQGAPATTGGIPTGGPASGAAPPVAPRAPGAPAPAAPGSQLALTTPGGATQGTVAPLPTGAQKAVLYEEPVDPTLAATQTLAISGNVTWTFAATGPDGPEIVGTVSIPDRKLNMTVTIRRNRDTGLPASHMVEVRIDAAPDKTIQTVPTMVMKSSEDSRGDVLIGASATVAQGYYWIALSGAQRDVSSNLGLLRDRGWIDIRLVYQSGQRAILTLEKGASGETAFARALSAWRTG
jgi:hypothetical protein